MSVGFGRGGKKIAHLGQDDRFVAIGERRRRRSTEKELHAWE